MIGMANLLDAFQSDSRAGEEKKCIFIARGGLTGRTVKVFLTYLKAQLFSWSTELFHSPDQVKCLGFEGDGFILKSRQ